VDCFRPSNRASRHRCCSWRASRWSGGDRRSSRINFLPRIKIPTILLDAKYDQIFPETSQKPFFHLLGSPPDRKRYVVYEGGHILPRTQLIRESLDWLDKYLGPVK
jgi:predicted alpha/beta-fold hydrolase